MSIIATRLVQEHRSTARAVSLSVWAFVVVCILSAMVGRLSYLTRPFNSDGAMFIYMGKFVAEGGRYNHELVDNKFPTVGLLTSLPWRLFGNDWASYVWLQFGMTIGMSLLLARTAQRHFSRQAILPTFCFAMVFLNLNPVVFGGFQLETIQAFFCTIAACSAIEAIASGDQRDSFLAGLATGCAMMVKPTGLSVLVAFAVALCISRRLRLGGIFAHAIATLAGLLIPAGVCIAYFIQTDIVGDLPRIWNQISTYAHSSAIAWEDLSKPLIAMIVLGVPIAVRGWVFRRDGITDQHAGKPLWIFAIAWLAIELIGVIAQRRMYGYHFLVLIPPGVLVYAMLPRTVRFAQLAGALTPIIVLSTLGAAHIIENETAKPKPSRAGQYLIQHTKPGQSIWADDMPRLLLETNLRPAARYPLTFLFLNHDQAAQEMCDVLLWDFDRNKPDYILLPTGLNGWLVEQATYCSELARLPRRRDAYMQAWRRIEAYVNAHYTRLAVVGDQTVYTRSPAR